MSSAGTEAGTGDSRALQLATDDVGPLTSHGFDVMGTSSVILVRGTPDEVGEEVLAAERELRELSARLTRFDSSSELERLNDAGGGKVSDVLRELLVYSQGAHRITEGRVDVSLGAEIIAAGYDRTFDELDVPDTVDADDVGADRGGGFQLLGPGRELGYTISDDGVVTIRDGVRIDLGGIAKGWSADRIARRLAPIGSCVVNLGGDISVQVADGDEPWPIGVDLVTRTQSYDIPGGGLATSGLDRRFWRDAASGELKHHVIDPRTGSSAVTDIVRVTVFAGCCADAEVWAKALFLERRAAAVAEADRRAIPAIIVGKDGAVHLAGGLG